MTPRNGHIQVWGGIRLIYQNLGIRTHTDTTYRLKVIIDLALYLHCRLKNNKRKKVILKHANEIIHVMCRWTLLDLPYKRLWLFIYNNEPHWTLVAICSNVVTAQLTFIFQLAASKYADTHIVGLSTGSYDGNSGLTHMQQWNHFFFFFNLRLEGLIITAYWGLKHCWAF